MGDALLPLTLLQGLEALAVLLPGALGNLKRPGANARTGRSVRAFPPSEHHDLQIALAPIVQFHLLALLVVVRMRNGECVLPSGQVIEDKDPARIRDVRSPGCPLEARHSHSHALE